jgi:hypothetical protein
VELYKGSVLIEGKERREKKVLDYCGKDKLTENRRKGGIELKERKK